MINNAFTAGKKLLCGDYSQYTPTGKGYFTKMGCFGKEPKLGAEVYFHSSSMGRVAHVGGVIDVKKIGDVNKIKTVEGNTSSGAGFDRNGGCVEIKEYTFRLSDVGGTNRINGFGYPRFGDDTCTVEEYINVLKSDKWKYLLQGAYIAGQWLSTELRYKTPPVAVGGVVLS